MLQFNETIVSYLVPTKRGCLDSLFLEGIFAGSLPEFLHQTPQPVDQAQVTSLHGAIVCDYVRSIRRCFPSLRPSIRLQSGSISEDASWWSAHQIQSAIHLGDLKTSVPTGSLTLPNDIESNRRRSSRCPKPRSPKHEDGFPVLLEECLSAAPNCHSVRVQPSSKPR